MYNFFVTFMWRICICLTAVLALGIGCAPKAKQVVTNPFEAYVKVFGSCVVGPVPEGEDCSEFDSDDGPLTVALIKAVKEIPAERQKLIGIAESDMNSLQQEAAFSILRRALTRDEMRPICKNIGENPDSERIVTVLVYLKEDESNGANNQLVWEIVRNTILKTSRSQNITVVANTIHSLGRDHREQGANTFMLSLKARLGRRTDSAKLIKNMILQSYNYGFFPEKDILAMRTDVERVYGKEIGADMFAFTTDYANLKRD